MSLSVVNSGGHFGSRLVYVGGISKEGLLAQLDAAGVQRNESGLTLLLSDRFATSAERRPLNAIEVSVRDLNFADGATMSELQDKAAALGYAPPPLELGPYLRLQYLDQPEGHWGQPVTRHRAPPGSLTIASQPPPDDDEFPKGFYLRRIEGDLWLRGYHSGPKHIWDPSDRLVFVSR